MFLRAAECDVTRLAIIAIALLMALPCLAQERSPDERQIRRDCSADAVRYCPKQVLAYFKGETPQVRAAVIECMLANRDKLGPKCSRHLWR